VGSNEKTQLKRERYGHGGTMSVTPALRWNRQEDHKFKARLGYILRLCLKKTKAESIA
jgi:hypothetical protein